jgi:hypothetical protein
MRSHFCLYPSVCVSPQIFIRRLIFVRSLFNDDTGNFMGRDSAVGIATSYGLDYQWVRVRVPVGARILISPCRPNRLWGPSSLLSNGYWGLFPGGKSAGAWSWPLTTNAEVKKMWVYISTPSYVFMA